MDSAAGFTVRGRSLEDGRPVQIGICAGRITRVDPDLEATQGVDDASPLISAGWVDLQINGAGPHDANGQGVDGEAIQGLVQSIWRAGVTGALLTIITAAEASMIRSFEVIASACETDPIIAASVIGIHVEGPHISAEDGPRGVHPAEHIRPPDLREFERWQRAAKGRIRMVTVAPEWDGSGTYIRALVDAGVVVSIGHTAASTSQIAAAVDAGATASTHLGNGSHALIKRHPNYIWDQLNEDRLTAGFIFDGTLLPPSVMKPMLRAKGIHRSFLVSDAVAVRGSTPGDFECFDGTAVTVDADGRVQVTGTPYFAGAVAMLPAGISNAVRYGGCTVQEAIALVTSNPRRLLGDSRSRGHGGLSPGSDANLTVFRYSPSTHAIDVSQTVVAGQVVYTAPT